MDHTAPPISIRFSDILIVGGDVPWMHDSAAGLSITGHEYPGENVKGSLSMRNVVIRDTRGAGVRLTSKAADAATMWQADISNLTIQNCASAWPAPPPPTAKEPHPCSMSAAPIIVNWFSNDVHLPWVPACWKNGTCTLQPQPVPMIPTRIAKRNTVLEERGQQRGTQPLPSTSCSW